MIGLQTPAEQFPLVMEVETPQFESVYGEYLLSVKLTFLVDFIYGFMEY